MATKPMPAPKPKEDPMDKGVWTVEKGTPPPMPDEGPTKDIKPPKKYAKGGAIGAKYMKEDADEVEKNITPEGNSRVRGLGPSMAAARLRKASDQGEYAAPGMGDAGQFLKKGGSIKAYASGGSVSSRADGCAQRGKTRGMMR